MVMEEAHLMEEALQEVGKKNFILKLACPIKRGEASFLNERVRLYI